MTHAATLGTADRRLALAAGYEPTQATFTGVVRHAHVAHQRLDSDGATRPVVVLELEGIGPGFHTLTAHVPFTHDSLAEAEALAKRLKRGQEVEVAHALIDLRLFLPAASIVTPA